MWLCIHPPTHIWWEEETKMTIWNSEYMWQCAACQQWVKRVNLLLESLNFSAFRKHFTLRMINLPPKASSILLSRQSRYNYKDFWNQGWERVWSLGSQESHGYLISCILYGSSPSDSPQASNQFYCSQRVNSGVARVGGISNIMEWDGWMMTLGTRLLPEQLSPHLLAHPPPIVTEVPSATISYTFWLFFAN